MKNAIIYKSRYGATRDYAAWISDRLRLPVCDADMVGAEELSGLDLVILGTSVYIGKMLVRDWLREHQLDLLGKKIFLFVVCGTPASEREKQLAIVDANIPRDLIDADDIFFLPGRLNKKGLSLTDRILLYMGAKLEKDSARKRSMLQDADEVRQEHLAGLLKAAEAFRAAHPTIHQACLPLTGS